MAHFDLVCKDCGHRFELVTGGASRRHHTTSLERDNLPQPQVVG